MTQARNIALRTRMHLWLRRLLVLLAVMVTLGWGVSRLQRRVGQETERAGFVQGLWQGALMPLALPVLFAGQDLPIYAPVNTGRTYNLGYTMGVNLCGLVFFGVLFARLAQMRRRLAQRQGPRDVPADQERLAKPGDPS